MKESENTPDVASARRLSGQVAIITGAGSGMGRATALAFAREGARLALFGRRPEPLEETAQLVVTERGEALTFPLDVADDQAVTAAVGAIVQRWGQVDILVNNAGTNTPRRALREVAMEDWHRLIATNLTGVFVCAHAVLPVMRAKQAGLIINVLSGAAIQGSAIPGVAYSAAKRGAVAISQVINAEEMENGIRATNVYPGDTVTPIMEKRPVPPTEEQKALMLQPEDIAATVLYVATLPDRCHVLDLNIRPWKKRR